MDATKSFLCWGIFPLIMKPQLGLSQRTHCDQATPFLYSLYFLYFQPQQTVWWCSTSSWICIDLSLHLEDPLHVHLILSRPPSLKAILIALAWKHIHLPYTYQRHLVFCMETLSMSEFLPDCQHLLFRQMWIKYPTLHHQAHHTVHGTKQILDKQEWRLP